MIRVTVLPAKRGDALLVEYGNDTKLHRILVDSGFKSTYSDEVKPALSALDGNGEFELLVVTHVDLDHVNGVLTMFEDANRPVTFGDVWFNAFEHLQGKKLSQFQSFGGPQGEELSVQLRQQHQTWNSAFDGKPAISGGTAIDLDDNATITVLSPTQDLLTVLIPKWTEECENAGLTAGIDAQEPATVPGFESFGPPNVEALAAVPFQADDSESNGATISFILEHRGKRLLLTGDADARRLKTALEPLAAAEGGKVRLDAMQIPHHGSRGNLSKEVLELVSCSLYFVSTDGSSFRHPHDETIARVAKFGGAEKEVVFNYKDRATKWNQQSLVNDFGLRARAPTAAEPDGTIAIEV
ncbi:MAG TPA: hypothetical protein VF148_13605 [Acidimicrobiia bacterium]